MKVRIGIIGKGFGMIGHRPAFESVRGCTVVGVCEDRSQWRAFLKRDDLDAVAIAVPPDAQYQIAKAAIQKGLHVFAEKPLAANLKQARELLALAKSKKIVHGVDFIFPEIAAWQKAKELLDTKAFGALKHLSVNWDWLSGEMRHQRSTWRSDMKRGGGALATYFSHGFNYIEFFAGPIAEATAAFEYVSPGKSRVEVGFDMLLKFKNGITGYAHVSSNAPGYVCHRLVFQCEEGVIVLEARDAIVDSFTLTTYSHKGAKIVKVKNDIGKKGEDERVKSVRKLAQRFVDACLKGKRMSPSFVEGVRVQELIEKVRTAKI